MVYEITLVCKTCGKKVQAEKHGYRDVPVPPGWGLVDGSYEKGSNAATAGRGIEPELHCADHLAGAVGDVVKGAEPTDRVHVRVERFVR